MQFITLTSLSVLSIFDRRSFEEYQIKHQRSGNQTRVEEQIEKIHITTR
jgi:hypothetical protein